MKPTCSLVSYTSLLLNVFVLIVRAAHYDDVTREPLCFAAVSFFLFSSVRDVRGLSADRCETLPGDWKWLQF